MLGYQKAGGDEIFITANTDDISMHGYLHLVQTACAVKETLQKESNYVVNLKKQKSNLLNPAQRSEVQHAFPAKQIITLETVLVKILEVNDGLTDRERLYIQRKLLDHGLGLRSKEFRVNLLFLAGFARAMHAINHWNHSLGDNQAVRKTSRRLSRGGKAMEPLQTQN